MNKQKHGDKRGIAWTDYTWNVAGGCFHRCEFVAPDGKESICYARSQVERMAGTAPGFYPEGFEHYYWHPERLQEPLYVTEPSKIFIDSMADLFGAWVPADHIKQVLDACGLAHQHTFQVLTKNPKRLPEFEFPPNMWVGVSVPATRMNRKEMTERDREQYIFDALVALLEVDATVRWMSLEPLTFDVTDVLKRSSKLPLEWAVIGALSNGRKYYQPEPWWVDNLLKFLNVYDVPVFMKDNLDWPQRREEFPE